MILWSCVPAYDWGSKGNQIQLYWGSKGSQIQYDFNVDLINKATESLIAYEGVTFEGAAAFVSSIIADLAYRNKLIKIADQSESGNN